MSEYTHLIVGLGKTGYSVASYWAARKIPFRAIDTRVNFSDTEHFKRQFPEVPLHIGGLHSQWIQDSQEIVLSPGIPPELVHQNNPHILKAIRSDIDLFDREANAPLIAITGSNGKSTVTMLIKHLLSTAGYRVKVGGNIGIPALNILEEPAPDFYILELSSFQLSITKRVRTAVSIFLNLSADHLERHLNLENYRRTKQMIYRNCKTAIWNRDDPATYPEYFVPQLVDFGTHYSPSIEGFNLIETHGDAWLMQGQSRLMNTNTLKIKGAHNHLNILAALATVYSLNHSVIPSVKALPLFEGPKHRLELIATQGDIKWINDSKATNGYATQAALLSFGAQDIKKVIWIAGGINKVGNDLSILIPLLTKYVKVIILIGKDAIFLKENFKNVTLIEILPTLSAAVQKASKYALPGDTILLSPACASQDMFKDYAERGDCFRNAIHSLLHLEKKS